MQRIKEVDFLRGIAIIMMVIFHFMFDLDYFGIVKNELYQGAWLVFQRITIGLFLSLAGLSMHLSYLRMKNKGGYAVLAAFAKRAVKLFAVALAITAATYFYLNGQGTIVFGVIHFIALATLIAVPILKFGNKKLLAALAVIAFALGYMFDSIVVNTPWLLWIGLKPVEFYTLDYVPLFPWFALIIAGIYAGKRFCPQGKTFYPDGKGVASGTGVVLPRALTSALSFLGRNSLAIYVMHQPVLIGLITLALMLFNH